MIAVEVHETETAPGMHEPETSEGDDGRTRRRYNSVVRRDRAAETRRRIVIAGSELLRSSNVRDWRGLTVRAVAERAGVNERTVYRHFVNERGLRDAVMRRLEDEVGIDLEGMKLEDVADVAARTLRQVSSFPLSPRQALDPTLDEAKRRQHIALLKAVGTWSEEWTDEDSVMAAGVFDVLWSVACYERLVGDWDLDSDQAIRAVSWVIEVLEGAIREGAAPTGEGSTA
ncbi:MAG TPA: TetR/AcrR family transcriptional regulator [Acidimicrobiales bacterium]|nr:TetR/AcrR family transcriptional regulator [Acidimicrobiales bacterium]